MRNIQLCCCSVSTEIVPIHSNLHCTTGYLQAHVGASEAWGDGDAIVR